MQTEIDLFLKEQNDLLSQQVDSLKSILTSYSEVEQSLQNKISNLKAEKEAQQALILAMKSELSKLEQGNFSEQLQQAFQENLKTLLARVLNQLDLNRVISNLVKIELKPIQMTIGTQQTDLEKALSKISQMTVPDNFYKDLEMQSERICMLAKTLEELIKLIKNLSS